MRELGLRKEMVKSKLIDFTIIDSMQAMVRIVDKDGTIMFANKSMKDKIGLDPIGTSCWSLSDKNINQCLIDDDYGLAGTIRQRKEIAGNFYLITSSPIFGEDGKFLARVEVFNDITRELKIQEDLIKSNKSLEDEIKFAGKVQSAILPAKGAHVGLDLDYRYISSSDLSGDIIDCIDIDDRFVGAYVADVVGHGVAASMLTMFIRQTMRYLVTSVTDCRPKTVLKDLNKNFSQLDLCLGEYFTIFYVYYDRLLRKLTYANAGHNGIPIWIRGNDCQELYITGSPISPIFTGDDYEQKSIQLEAGDEIILYTDGVTETQNYEKNLYGMDRLKNSLTRNKKSRLDDVILDLDKFRFGEQDDDIALLQLKIR